MFSLPCPHCWGYFAEDIKIFFWRKLNTVYAFADLRALSPLNCVENSFWNCFISFQVVLFSYLLEELLVNRNNDLSKLKIRKLFASQEGRWWLLIDWLLQMTCYVITTIVSANWKYKNFFASHDDMTLWWHYYYLLRGADDDMRKEDCIFSESRLLLGPVVEISNLIFRCASIS